MKTILSVFVGTFASGLILLVLFTSHQNTIREQDQAVAYWSRKADEMISKIRKTDSIVGLDGLAGLGRSYLNSAPVGSDKRPLREAVERAESLVLASSSQKYIDGDPRQKIAKNLEAIRRQIEPFADKRLYNLSDQELSLSDLIKRGLAITPPISAASEDYNSTTITLRGGSVQSVSLRYQGESISR